MQANPIDEIVTKLGIAINNVQRFKDEKAATYRTVQDFTVSANKTDEALERMALLTKTIRREEKTVRELEEKVKNYKKSNPTFTHKYDTAITEALPD